MKRKTNYRNNQQVFSHFDAQAQNIKFASNMKDIVDIQKLSFFSKFLNFAKKRMAISKATRRTSHEKNN